MMALARPRAASGKAISVLAALAVAAAVRAAANGHSALTGFATGGAFGILLVAVAVFAGWRPARPRPSSLLIGLLGGGVIVATAQLAHPVVGAVVGMRPEPFAVWVFVTALVVMGEEAVLRGALFRATEVAAGPIAAVAVTSIAFALIHVPLYGWQVVPLDLGVGIWLGGLRLATGGIAAPVVAHLVADLSTWWL